MVRTEEVARGMNGPIPDPRVDGILEALANVGALMERQAQQQVVANTEAGERRMQKLIEQFLKLKPSNFSRIGDPDEAEHWIDGMEKIFRLLNCNDNDRITLAEYQLEGNAKNWRRASRETVFPVGTAVTREGFVGAFNAKYFSGRARDQKMAEFMRLAQGNLKVDQYEAKFAALSRFTQGSLIARRNIWEKVQSENAPLPRLVGGAADLNSSAADGADIIIASRASIFQEIMEALGDDKLKVIGVHGPGGVGKTTLLEEAEKKLRKEGKGKPFHIIAKARVSQNQDLAKIRYDIADALSLNLKDEPSEEGKKKDLL